MDKLIINDIPLSELGAILAPDSYKSVLTWAKFKPIKSNDWAESNYAEPDLSMPYLDKRTVTLNFHCISEIGYVTFVNYLLQYTYSFFEFPELGVTLRLRVISNNIKEIGKWDSFSISFSDDSPYMQVEPSLSEIHLQATGYELDDVEFSKFGIDILKGTLASVIKKTSIKEKLLINENSFDGVIYDGTTYPTLDGIKYQVSQFTLKCLLRAVNLQAAVSNYYYLLNVLKQPNKRRIHIAKLQGFIDCYYSSNAVSEVINKLSSGLAGIAFDLTFTIVDKCIAEVLSDDTANKALTSDDSRYYLTEKI